MSTRIPATIKTSMEPARNGRAPRRALHWLLWILQVSAAGGFTVAALGKITGDPQSIAVFQELGWEPWTRFAVAGLELAGSVALLIPRLTGLAALAFVALMLGAVTVQLVTGGSIVMAVIMLVLAAVIAWGRRSTWSTLLHPRNPRS